MKGVFTQIKYMSQGVILREAKMSGMVVGIPIHTERRKQIMLGDAADLTAGTHSARPTIDIYGNNTAFDYRDGDVLHSLRLWIRKSSERPDQAIEMLDSGAAITIAKTNYGTSSLIVDAGAEPVKARTIPQAATYNNGTGKFSAIMTDIAAGDTIVTGGKIGKVGAPSISDGVTAASVTWANGAPSAGAKAVTDLYYDYTTDPVTAAPRGYVLYYSAIVYRTSIYGVHTISNPDQLTDMFGGESVTNPLSNLAMGAFLYTAANGFSSKFKICALDLRSKVDDGLEDVTPEDIMSTPTYWAGSTSKVDGQKDAYYLTTMTGNDAVQDLWEQYTITSSTTDRRRQKRYWAAKAVINGGVMEDEIRETFGSALHMEAERPSGELYEDGYIDGDSRVPFDKDADVEAAQATPMATNNERITYIGTEFASIGDVNIDGYLITAIIAGWRASNPLGYVSDWMAVPLLSMIPSVNGYYTDEDLDALQKAGWYMLTQETPGGPVVCYQQQTTAYDNASKAEESFIVAIDKALADIVETLTPYTKGGLENRVSSNLTAPVTARFIKKCNDAISGLATMYLEKEIFAAMEVIGVRVNEMRRYATEIDVKFTHYRPVREIYITGYIE